MRNRPLVRALACALAAAAVLVAPALADELIGRITAVNIDAKKLTVREKGTDKDVDVTVTDETAIEKANGKAGKLDLEKLKQRVEKAKNGISVEITHDKGVASKLVYKSGNPKKDQQKKDQEKKDEPKPAEPK
jgi:hypothetical protein